MNRLRKKYEQYQKYWSKKKQERQRYRNFYEQFKRYNQLAPEGYKAQKEYLYPCLHDATTETTIEPIYFYQDIWAFERILQQRPDEHIDIGSHHKFVAFLSKIIHVTMIDIRPLSLKLDSLHFKQGDILHLPFDDESVHSLSSLCVIEHIGLGRYGDQLDPFGSEKAFQEITRVLSKGANLYISVPVSDVNIIAFNAGRIFALDSLLTLCQKHYSICDQKFIVGKNLQDEFVPNDKFGTTILLHLIKK